MRVINSKAAFKRNRYKREGERERERDSVFDLMYRWVHKQRCVSVMQEETSSETGHKEDRR